MSGKTKKDAKMRTRAKDTAPAVKVTKVIEFRRTSKGALAPKARWERES